MSEKRSQQRVEVEHDERAARALIYCPNQSRIDARQLTTVREVTVGEC